MKHPLRVVIGFFVASIIGLSAIPQLNINLNPSYNLPELTLSFTLPNTLPEHVEQEATSLLENALSTLTHLNEINSVSHYNKGEVTLKFDRNVDIDFKKFEVISILRKLRPLLPDAMSYPIIYQNAEENRESPLLIFRANAPYATTKIKNELEKYLTKQIASVNGVDQVDITGAAPLQIVIDIDLQAAQVYNITQAEITQTISNNLKAHHIGRKISEHSHQYYVQFDPKVSFSLEAIKSLEIKRIGSTPLLLKNIALIYFEEETPNGFYRVNGLNSVSIRVFAKKNSNKIKVAKAVKKTIDNILPQLAGSITIIEDYNETTFLTKELNKIYLRAGLSVLILTLFMFLAYRNYKHLVVLILGILVTLCLTIFGAWVLHINIHMYTIAGTTIAFGLIVDNSIIMLDHLVFHKNRKIFLALLAATATTMAALSVIFFLPKEDRLNLTEFSSIIIISLVLSMIVALWFTPALYSLMFRTKNETRTFSNSDLKKSAIINVYSSIVLFLNKYKKIVILFLIFLFGTPIFLLPTKWEGYGWYNKSIGSDVYQEDIRPITDKLLGGTLRMFVRNVYEKSGYRNNEQTKLYVNAHLPFGHTLSQMNKALLKVEAYLSGIQGIDKFVSLVHSGQDASIAITFKEEFENSALPFQLKARLISQSLDWAGIEWSIYGVGRGFSNSSGNNLPGYRVLMKGYNYIELEKQAKILANKLLKHKRIQEVNTNTKLRWDEQSSTQVELSFDQNRMNYGITPVIAATNLNNYSYRTRPSNEIIIKNKRKPLLIKYANSMQLSIHDLSQSTFWENDSLQIDYTVFSKLEKKQTMNSIYKENRQYIRVVGFDYYGSDKYGTKYLKKVLAEMNKELPLGFSAKYLGWNWNWEKTKRNYSLLLLLIVAIYFICSILFESFNHPLKIIMIIPLSFIGLFITFAVFDFYFDQGGYGAFILLGGLTVNAAIFILFDLLNNKEGEYNQNVINAVVGKSKPILLTVASTCLGLAPFLFQGQNEVFWFSFAAGTIGGLLVSLVVVFFILPMLLLRRP